ncbi:hypothetical protein N1851_021392 [Merluccius polli]|uniref:DUF6729 domain-containing protein n=1 Tax=Merluccius polli TaxID=89951 RepID=A0AA47MK27_MERPO|nr:hypothetical protein N1851_021392 [Merluccius polli]
MTLATEYLECKGCSKKYPGWSEDILGQLDMGHRSQFPALLTYRYSCDIRVLRMMRERTMGNSVTQLYKKLQEQHSEAWLQRVLQYLTACFLSCAPPAFAKPPELPDLPKPKWLLAVYARDVLGRLHLVKAKITSIFGSVLKMDSTKKVQLLGAQMWGNEHGQVLVSVMTTREGQALDAMAAGLMKRYREAGEPPPKIMYVDRDCCSQHGPCRVKTMYAEWDGLQHGGIGHISEEAVTTRINRRELARHCRRRTRGVEETTRLIGSLISLFDSASGKDTLGVPLLDHQRIQHIWQEQEKHVACIQDPEDFQLYTKTGTLNKGGVELCCYRCARGSTSLESFHLHLNRFIPGELLGMEYLYSQTGKALTPVLQNPVEEAMLVEEINDEDIQDEGFEDENTEDITVPVLHEDDPSRQLPSSLMTSPQASPPQAPASPDDLPSMSCDGGQHPAAAPSALPDTSQAALDSDTNLSDEAQSLDRMGVAGWDKVQDLAAYLVGLREASYLSVLQVTQVIQLWTALPDCDKTRVNYQPRHQERTATWPF